MDYFKSTINTLSNNSDIFIIVTAIVLLISTIISYFVMNVSGTVSASPQLSGNAIDTDNKQASTLLTTLQNTKITLNPINTNDARFKHNLRDYYIKSSYNSCLVGKIKNGYVSVKPLIGIIKNGVRVLDFEVFYLKGKAIIACSNSDSFDYKDTINQLLFDDVMGYINKYALSGSYCQNYSDPLILHFRIKSAQSDVFKQMSDSINKHLGNYLLDNSYSYEANGTNIGAEPIANFMNKIIISCNSSNPAYKNTPFEEYINFTSGSQFCRLLTDNDIKYGHNPDELKQYNKKNMCITTPSPGFTQNSSANLHMSYGCQMIMMDYSLQDNNLKHYNELYNNYGYAYMLKPESLRYVVTTIADPKKQDPSLSYARKVISKPYYKFEI